MNTRPNLWYYANSANEPVGPLSFENLQKLHSVGMITAGTLVIGHGDSEWKKFGGLESVGPRETSGLQNPPEPKRDPAPGAIEKSGAAAVQTASSYPTVSTTVADKAWYVMIDGVKAGPFGKTDLQDLWNGKKLTPFTQVWCEGFPSWRCIRDLPGVFPMLYPVDSGSPRAWKPWHKQIWFCGLIFLLMPYVAVPMFWIRRDFGKVTRIVLSVFGALLTGFIILSAYADGLPENVGRRAGEADASLVAEKTDNMARALVLSREFSLESHPEIAHDSEKKKAYVEAYDQAFQRTFPVARKAAEQQAHER